MSPGCRKAPSNGTFRAILEGSYFDWATRGEMANFSKSTRRLHGGLTLSGRGFLRGQDKLAANQMTFVGQVPSTNDIKQHVFKTTTRTQ